MRNFLLSLTLGAALAAPLAPLPAPVQAQDFSPVVYINNSAITRYELDQRIRFMKVLGSPEQGAAQAEKMLIEDRLRIEAARRLGVVVSDQGLEAGLSEFAGRANMSTDQFIAALARSGVERQAYRDFVKAGVAWREVVRRRVLPQIRVSDGEIDQTLQRVIETPLTTAMLISEIIIPAPPGREKQALAQAKRISETTRSERQFAASARKFSATASRRNGGRLPWMQIDNMPPALRSILSQLKPGQVTPPLTVQGAVVLFMLRDTRGKLRPGAKDQVLDYARLTVESGAKANGIAARARSCDELYVHARPYPESQMLRDNRRQSAIPVDIAVALASLDANEATVIDRGSSADVVMLCKRTPALIAGLEGGAVATATEDAPADPNALPDREAVREQIFNQKVNRAAEAYLAELRADAIIRRP